MVSGVVFVDQQNGSTGMYYSSSVCINHQFHVIFYGGIFLTLILGRLAGVLLGYGPYYCPFLCQQEVLHVLTGLEQIWVLQAAPFLTIMLNDMAKNQLPCHLKRCSTFTINSCFGGYITCNESARGRELIQ